MVFFNRTFGRECDICKFLWAFTPIPVAKIPATSVLCEGLIASSYLHCQRPPLGRSETHDAISEVSPILTARALEFCYFLIFWDSWFPYFLIVLGIITGVFSPLWAKALSFDAWFSWIRRTGTFSLSTTDFCSTLVSRLVTFSRALV